jgi:1-deoxy-D-xylulose-5-phosphate reductoisomerase
VGLSDRVLSVAGSTGSIGTQTLDVIRSLPEEFEVVGLGAGNNWRLLAEQIKQFQPCAVSLANEESLSYLKKELPPQDTPELAWGSEGMKNLAGMPEADLIVIAVTGTAGIYPTFAALNAGKDVALANKETLVAAGQLVMDLAARKNKSILPVDSEHSAVWQCLNGHSLSELEKIILTASGGPFRCISREELKKVTDEMALSHPNWSMGSKITIDSATLMNKGLEVIEAKWLFGVDYDQIEIVIHPQSIIHSAVEFKDGSVLAQMGRPDMHLPIQYALTFPRRIPGAVSRLDWTKLKELTFEAPDTTKFPSLHLAYEAGKTGGTMPAVLNAANEMAVHAFLQRKLPFLSIPMVVEKVMGKHTSINNPDLGEIMEADHWARTMTGEFLRF